MNRIKTTKEAQIKKILVSLGMKFKKKKKDALEFLAPSFRRDLKIEEDLIEEISRVYGFDKIPETLSYIMPKDIRPGLLGEAICLIKQTLIASNLREVITYSMVSEAMLKKAGQTCFYC